MYQKKKENIEVSISEPAQKLTKVNISFKDYKIDDINTSKNKISIQLPQGEKAGKTTTFYIKK